MRLIFEGSEKKLELVVDGSVNLLNLSENIWHSIVKASRAQILSKIETDQCKAFLLSESSLFVWKNRFTLITCGTTTLSAAVLDFLVHMDKSVVKSIIYQRKNEYFPHEQRSHFFQDAEQLSEYFPGKIYRFGEADGHHVFMYIFEQGFVPPSDDRTLEILMYDFAKDTLDFNNPGLTATVIREALNLDKVLPGFVVDDHVFDPVGYSLNALYGEYYYTIHVTPQNPGCYVSFETNYLPDENFNQLLDGILEVFRPKTFDYVAFNERPFELVKPSSYSSKCYYYGRLEPGYSIHYGHLFQREQNPIHPELIKEF